MTSRLSVHQLFSQQARRTPHATALVGCDGTLTYEQLDARSNDIAHALLDRGIQPGQLVGICLQRHTQLLVTLLGILKCGAAYVPLDPAYPTERLVDILQAAQPSLILTEACLQTVLPMQLPCVLLEHLQVTQSGEINVILPEDALSYVIFTSGSTGKPKGVQVRHAAVSNLFTGMQALLQIQSDDRWLALAPISFDISVLELFMPICFGACVVVATREQAIDVNQLAPLLSEVKITLCQATPATWRMLQTLPAFDRADAPLLRQACCGGEAWGRDLGDFLLRIAQRVWNLYGPTETTVWSTALQLTAQGDVHLGSPILNTTVYVLDDQLQPLPVGEAGELYLGGEGLARGYLGQPELTVEKFIANPFGAGRLYKTGDLVSRREDGGLNFLGRIDFQVKLRGHRIELGEIEATLAQHPAVHYAVVTAHDDGLGNKRLVAYYQAKATTNAAELRQYLNERLPLYMVPSAYAAVAKFPLNPSGKVDRKALPAPTQFLADVENYVAPRTTNEAILSHMWAGLLGVERVGVLDNFFDLGGDSLNATELMMLIQKRFDTALPIGVLLSHPTVAEMAELLGQPQYDIAPRRSVRMNAMREQATPFFCVPPIGGVASVFAPLARALSGQIAMHGLQVSGIRYARDQVQAMPQLIAAYASEIQTLYPTGPLNLMGYSAGGAITHALIDALLAAGREIEIVFLLNPYGRPPLDFDGYDHTGDFWNVWSDLLGDAFDLRGEPAAPLMALSRAMWPDPGGKVHGHAQFVWPHQWPSQLSDAAAMLPRNVSAQVFELLIQGVHTTWLAYREYHVAPLKHEPKFKQIWMVQPDADNEDYRLKRVSEWSAYMRVDLPPHLVPGEHAKLLRNPKTVAAIAQLIRRVCR